MSQKNVFRKFQILPMRYCGKCYKVTSCQNWRFEKKILLLAPVHPQSLTDRRPTNACMALCKDKKVLKTYFQPIGLAGFLDSFCSFKLTPFTQGITFIWHNYIQVQSKLNTNSTLIFDYSNEQYFDCSIFGHNWKTFNL